MDEAYKQKLSAPIHSTLLDDFGLGQYSVYLIRCLCVYDGEAHSHELHLVCAAASDCCSAKIIDFSNLPHHILFPQLHMSNKAHLNEPLAR